MASKPPVGGDGASSVYNLRPVYGVEVDPTTRTIRPHGDVDFASAPLLRTAAKSLIFSPAGTITIDLAAVEFVDAALPNTIVAIASDVGPSQRIRIINYTAQIERVLLICGLQPYLGEIERTPRQ